MAAPAGRWKTMRRPARRSLAEPPTRVGRTARLAAGLLAIALVGCVVYRGPGDDRLSGPRTVGFVGDSIAHSAMGEIRAAGQARGWFTHVDATPGALSFEKQPSADAIAGSHPAAAVIELGTNDLTCAYANAFGGSCRFNPYTTDDMLGALATMAAGLRAAGACVVGVVPTWDDGKIADLWTRSAAAGTMAAVVDWKAVTTAVPGYLEDAFGHLNGPGRAAFAATVMDHVAGHCAIP
jgi:hypothetical protein